MKSSFLGCIGSLALALSALAQNPTPALEASPPSPPPASASASSPAIPPPPVASDDDEDLERSIERKVRRGLNGINITFGDEKDKGRAERRARREGASDKDIDENVERAIEDRIERKIERGMEDGALMAIPIVGIIFATLFGAPVAIVGVIMFFSYIKARSLHKTVRMMVEKGQPVPEALFAAPHTPAKQRSDMRRGVILVMVGIGVMILFGALDDWDGGAWALGIIPFLIGAGYLAVWVLEGNKLTFNRTADNHAGTDTPPPLP